MGSDNILKLLSHPVAIINENGSLKEWSMGLDQFLLENMGEKPVVGMNLSKMWNLSIQEMERNITFDGNGREVVASIRIALVSPNCYMIEIYDQKLESKIVERANFFLERSSEGLWEWDLIKNETHMSPQYWRMIGQDPAKLPHRGLWRELIFDEDHAAAIELIGRTVKKGVMNDFKTELRFRHAVDGSTVTVLSRGTVVEWTKDGQPARMIGSHIDLTEFKKVLAKREALSATVEAQNKELRSLINAVPCKVFAVDSDGKITTWNRKISHFMGLTAEEAISKPLGSVFLSEDTEHLEELAACVRTTSNPIHQSRQLNLTSVVGPRQVLINAVVRRNEKEDITGTIFVGLDVTDLISTRANLARAEERANAESRLNEFIAHEVRNPLSIAISAMRFVESNLSTTVEWKLPEAKTQVSNDMSLVQSSLNYINELLSNMLDLNTFLKDQVELHNSVMNVKNDLLQPVRTMLYRSSRNIPIIVECRDDMWVEADTLRLKQVIVNLVKNSLKFVTTGFIRVTAARDIANPGNIVLAVEDSGPGIPPSHLPTLFCKYQESLDLQRQGSGIGLSLCKAIVEAMSGTIELDLFYKSNHMGNPGARFVITLPLEQKEAPKDPESFLTGPSNQETRENSSILSVVSGLFGPSFRCVIVDDDAVLRELLKRLIQKISKQIVVFQFASGEEAIQFITDTDEPVHVIFVDHFMPGPACPLSGAETISALRNLPNASKSVIIGCSANDMEHEHMTSGADLFIRKPIPDACEIAQRILDALILPPALRFLVVDDESVNRSIMRRLIAKIGPGCFVEDASTAAQSLEKAVQNNDFDAIILDEHLGNTARGSEVAAELRTRHTNAVLISVSGSFDNRPPTKRKRLFDIYWPKPLPPSYEIKAGLIQALSHNRSLDPLNFCKGFSDPPPHQTHA